MELSFVTRVACNYLGFRRPTARPRFDRKKPPKIGGWELGFGTAVNGITGASTSVVKSSNWTSRFRTVTQRRLLLRYSRHLESREETVCLWHRWCNLQFEKVLQ